MGDQEAATLNNYCVEWLVWLLPLVAVVFVPMVSALGPKAREWFATLVSLLAAAFAVTLIPIALSGGTQLSISWLPITGFRLQIRVDGLSVFLALIVNLLGFLIVLYSQGYMKKETGLTRYYCLVLLFIGSMTGLVMAGNLLQMYIFWELVGICSSFLIAFWYDRPEAVRAGLKAFIVTRAGDVGLFIGLILLYVNTGTFSFDALETMAGEGKIAGGILLASGLLILLGAMGKSAQFPLHVWLPDAMEGPTTVSALIHAATMVNAGVYLVARVTPIFGSSNIWLGVVAWVGIISAILGATMAGATLDLKRVLAYSTISQLGFMFLALGIGSPGGWFSSQFHLMSQAAFKALGFLAAGSLIHVLGTRNMDEMGGLGRRMPVTFIAFFFSVLAMSGLPPFIGFWSKDLIITELNKAGDSTLSVLALFVSICTSFYAFRAFFKIFYGKPSELVKSKQIHESPLAMAIPLAVLSIAVATLWLVEGAASRLLGVVEPEPTNPWIYAASLSALVIGFLPAYALYLRQTPEPSHLLVTHSWMSATRNVLLEGYGFDRLYSRVFASSVTKLGSAVRWIQTGSLGKNMWGILLFMLVVALVVLAL
jgi:NADH-quinone oxidoreductase subunit L